MPVIYNTTFAKAIGCMTMFMFMIGLFRPGITREDGVVEWATALTFLATVAIASYLAAKPGLLHKSRDRIAMAGVAAFALLLSLSELSFGARLFGLEMPAMKGGGEFDGGHDVVIWTMRKIAAAELAIQMALIVCTGLSIAVAIAWAWQRRAQLGKAISLLLEHPVRFRFAVTIILLACAVILDLMPYHKIGILEEVLEFAASVAMLMTATAAINSTESFTVAVAPAPAA